MKFDCSNIREVAGSLPLIEACDTVRDGSLRLATPFRYADGSNIDVFLESGGELLPTHRLTDKGQTVAYLLDLHLKPWTTRKRRQLVQDICAGLGVEQNGGAFSILVKEGDLRSLPSDIARLAQACIRVSDLVFAQRLRTPVIFKEEFEEHLVDIDRPYESDIVLSGDFGKEVAFDFLVQGLRQKSLIQTISTANQTASHTICNEVFTRWYDITNQRPNYQCLTVYDSTNDVFRDSDLARLGSLSDVVAYPAEADKLKLALAA